MTNAITKMTLWNSVDKTDVAFTKQAKKGAYSFTAITPMSQKKKATEVFGVQGLSWGVEPESERFEYKEFGTTTLLNYTAVMFFDWNGGRGRIPIASTEKIAYVTSCGKGYLKVDDEALKKVKTGALTKGLSELGFNADIHLGLFDDYEYLRERKEESEIEHASNKDEAIANQVRKIEAEIDSVIILLKTARSANEINGLYNATGRRAYGKTPAKENELKDAYQNALLRVGG